MAKQKRATIAQKSPDSKRTARRKNRGFESLERHSRKHRRAARRLAEACTQYGKLGKPGDKLQDSKSSDSFVHTCGGGINYH